MSEFVKVLVILDDLEFEEALFFLVFDALISLHEAEAGLMGLG